MMFYLVPVIGAIAVFMAMPGERKASRLGAVVLGVVALGAMVAILSGVIGHSKLMFYVFAVVAVLAAARVVTHSKPVYSAVYFLLVVLAVAGIALLAHAEFLAAALLIIYAGAILVTYLFVIMLAQQPTLPEYDRLPREPAFAVLAGFVLVAALAAPIVYSRPGLAETVGRSIATTTTDNTKPATDASKPVTAEQTWPASNTLAIGTELMTVHVVAFEAAGVLLLVGIIGGIAMATRRLKGGATSCGGGAA